MFTVLFKSVLKNATVSPADVAAAQTIRIKMLLLLTEGGLRPWDSECASKFQHARVIFALRGQAEEGSFF